MEFKNHLKFIEQIRNNPELLASEGYIDLQLDKNWLHNLAFQMGPNCNRHCFHCYGNYGPTRKGLPSLYLAQKTLEECEEAVMFDVTLTDGEPFRLVNKEVIKLFARYSDKYPFSAITNSAFSGSFKGAKSWMELLRDNGLDFTRHNRFLVSSGKMYDVPMKNHTWFLKAFREVFPKANPCDHIFYSYYNSLEDFDKEVINIGELVDSIASAFDDLSEPTASLIVVNSNFEATLKFSEDLEFIIGGRPYDPQGRGKNGSRFIQNRCPRVEYNVDDMKFYPDSTSSLIVSSSGEVSYGVSLACFSESRKFGNVLNEPLVAIKKRIHNDEVYQAFRLGGTRFIYALAKEVNPNLVLSGNLHCDACTALFNDVSLIEIIRNNLKRDDVVKSYKKYLDLYGLPKLSSAD